MRVCTPVGKDRSIDTSYRLRKPTLGALYFHFLFTFFYRNIFLSWFLLFAPVSDPPVVKQKTKIVIEKKSNEKHIKKENTNLYVREREKERIDCGACESSLSAHLETLPFRN